MLTYAVVPEPDPARPAVALTTLSVICSGDPRRLTPADVHDHHVAARAVRHLAHDSACPSSPAAATGSAASRTTPTWSAISAQAGPAQEAWGR